MCGFAGFISNNLINSQARHNILKMMGKSLLHRGPDQSGEFNYLKRGLSLVHQRLSILDTSENGRQPMSSPSGRFVIAFNGDPVRLLILEVTAFAFGLATLFGIIMLVIRRLTNKRVQIVTSKMDMVVFATLLTQIISGVYIAYFHRYGSTWFAASLTPYLRSIFAFNPDMSVVASMPLAVKIHVLSAFAIVGIIPFTRYMHFLVYPIAYIWRPYQKVIWNWNKNDIRKSTKLVYGKRSKNN